MQQEETAAQAPKNATVNLDFDTLRLEIDRELDRLLPVDDAAQSDPQRKTVLIDAMRYALLTGGKRIRPMLCLLTADALTAAGTAVQAERGSVAGEAARMAGCAIEALHAYSLIHDDLPAMDDDDLRRGEPTCHIRFGEAMAILAGDALQTLAFDILAGPGLTALGVEPSSQLRMLHQLAAASGAAGMVGGQALDLTAEGRDLNEDALSALHAMKTGALIETAVIFGLCVHNIDDQRLEADLRRFGKLIGLAFQVQDDILDVASDTASLGKTAGKDEQQDKSTFVRLMGLDGARQHLDALFTEADEILRRRAMDQTPLGAFTRQLATRIR
ncbi:(2E,6E)-farnesyl diphosphate synthase [Allohahella marinimesophila]|uniref:(2E,6E)-farnesyl diphosphate synthase n=2 Tax=Allohahella marinimesophila TaxID=1054972 RepID=A0ABP7NGH9_9GAMM